MCDYSLQTVRSRPAKVGGETQKLAISLPGTRGFCCGRKMRNTAVLCSARNGTCICQSGKLSAHAACSGRHA